MQKSSVSQCVGLVALALGWSTQCHAQSPAPARSRVQIIHVKPEMVNEFLDIEKNEVVPAFKEGWAEVANGLPDYSIRRRLRIRRRNAVEQIC